MANTPKHRDPDYSIVEETGMRLGKAPNALHVPGISDEALRETERLCARDYLEHHVFFNHIQFHNHCIYHLLASLSLGAAQKRLREIYDLNITLQRPLLEPVPGVTITKANMHEYLGKEEFYANYIEFFRCEIRAEGGDWRSVLVRYMFDNEIYPLVFSGLIHPLIHIGLSIEFESTLLIAMSLAQACIHSSMFRTTFSADVIETTIDDQPLMKILENIRSDVRVNDIPYLPMLVEDAPVCEQVALDYLQQWKVSPTEECIALKYRELQSVIALLYGATTPHGYRNQYEFSLMHLLTSSYFVTMVLGVLTVEQQVRVLRSYVFVVLRHYAIEHCPQFYRIDEVATDDVSFATGDEYCSDEQWKRVFAKAIQNDDMHIAKVVHALWYGSILNHNAPPAPADYQMPPSINWLLLAQNTVECINMSSYEDEDEQFMAGKRGWSRGKIGFSQYWKQSGEAL